MHIFHAFIHSNFAMTITLIVIYFVLGAGVKYVDAAYDEHTFRTKYTLPIGIALGTLAGLTMIVDQPSLIIFLSLIIGVAVTYKLDILPFRVLAVVATMLPFFYFRGKLPLSSSDWGLILFLSASAAIDEIGNDLADAKVLKRLTRLFFLYRGYLKVLIVVIVFLRYLPTVYVIAFLGFDLGYLLLGRLSARRSARLLSNYPLLRDQNL